MSKNAVESANLYFDGMLVAQLSAFFEDQGTWFADYRLVEDIPAELEEFVQFSINELSEGRFADSMYIKFMPYMESLLWRVKGQGWEHQLSEAPLFRQNDMSFLTASRSLEHGHGAKSEQKPSSQ